jgi:hypothetical protein
MTVLADARYERFAMLVSQGETGTDAYLAAGFVTQNRRSANVSATRLRKRTAVKARIAELCQERAALEAGTSTAIEALVRELALILVETPGPIDKRAERLADVLRRGREAMTSIQQ